MSSVFCLYNPKGAVCRCDGHLGASAIGGPRERSVRDELSQGCLTDMTALPRVAALRESLARARVVAIVLSNDTQGLYANRTRE